MIVPSVSRKLRSEEPVLDDADIGAGRSGRSFIVSSAGMQASTVHDGIGRSRVAQHLHSHCALALNRHTLWIAACDAQLPDVV
jgi:hypothetical protein